MARWRFYLSGGNDFDTHTYGIVEAESEGEAYHEGVRRFVKDRDAYEEAEHHFGYEPVDEEQRQQDEDDETYPYFTVEELTAGETMDDFADEPHGEEEDDDELDEDWYGEDDDE